MSGAQLTTDKAIRAQIDGLLSWWALAGVDSALDEDRVNWFDLPARSAQGALTPASSAPQPVERHPLQQNPNAITRATGNAPLGNPHVTTPQTRPQPAPLPVSAPSQTAFPDSLPAFHDYLAHAPDLPEARWPGPRALPVLPATVAAPANPENIGTENAGAENRTPHQPRLMIILPAPDINAAGINENSETNSSPIPLRPEALRLLHNMLRSIDITLDECAIATLSLITPPGGMIDSDLVSPLARRMRHHIALISPKAVLLVGDETKSALLSANDSIEPKNSLFVSHAGGTVACAAILHPRLMLEQPSAKAEAWKSLRAFIRNREH